VVAGVEPWRCFLPAQLYACNSSERDEVLSLWRLVRFELVMTQNFKLRRASTGAFFHGQPKTCAPIMVTLINASVTQTAILVVTSAHGTKRTCKPR
jgi:hypothetical protein